METAPTELPSALPWTNPHEQVTEEDFIEHHANLSFGVKGDADFRELVISCWGLDGGGGAGGDKGLPADVADVLRRAHAPHRKFLVSYADGSQCVEDLPFLTTVSRVKLVSVSSVHERAHETLSTALTSASTKRVVSRSPRVYVVGCMPQIETKGQSKSLVSVRVLHQFRFRATATGWLGRPALVDQHDEECVGG